MVGLEEFLKVFHFFGLFSAYFEPLMTPASSQHHLGPAGGAHDAQEGLEHCHDGMAARKQYKNR